MDKKRGKKYYLNHKRHKYNSSHGLSKDRGIPKIYKWTKNFLKTAKVLILKTFYQYGNRSMVCHRNSEYSRHNALGTVPLLRQLCQELGRLSLPLQLKRFLTRILHHLTPANEFFTKSIFLKNNWAVN